MNIKSLMYRSRYRGCRESELILGSFAETMLPRLCSEQLLEYAKILELDDVDLMGWLFHNAPLPDYYRNSTVLYMIKEFSRLAG